MRVLELNVLGFREVRPEIMRRAGLQCLAVLHHRFDRIGIVGAGETFVGRLLAGDDRHGQHVLGERAIDLEHLQRLVDRVLAVGVRRMAFLPKELGRAQEQARAHLPAHDVRPLVDQQRQIAIALDPALEGVADDRLRSRTNDQRLFELGVGIDHQLAVLVLEAVVGDDRHLLGEALDVLGLLGDEAHGDEQREVAVVVAGILDAGVELRLHALPHAPAPRLDDHAAAHGAGFGHVAIADDCLIPLGEVLLAGNGECALAHRPAPDRAHRKKLERRISRARSLKSRGQAAPGHPGRPESRPSRIAGNRGTGNGGRRQSSASQEGFDRSCLFRAASDAGEISDIRDDGIDAGERNRRDDGIDPEDFGDVDLMWCALGGAGDYFSSLALSMGEEGKHREERDEPHAKECSDCHGSTHHVALTL